MKQLTIPYLLWLVCLTLQFSELSSLTTIIVCLVSLSLTSLALYWFDRRAAWLSLSYQVVALFWPPLLPFLPMTVYFLYGYGLQHRKWLWLSALSLFPLAVSLPPQLFQPAILVFCLLALLLARAAHLLHWEQRRFYTLQDDTREQTRAMERKNQLLLEKQDYQVQLATLAERNRIAREIHDNVGHLLTRSLFQVSALEVASPQLKEPLSLIKATLSDAMDTIRSSVHDLHDEALDLRLEAQKLADAFAFCPVQLRYDCGPIAPAIHYCFLAIIKEGLSNVARHSNATQVQISLLEHPGLYQLIIEDNGSRKDSAPSGIGLLNIQERVDALRGVFHTDQTHGFRLFISIPKSGKDSL